MNNYLFTSQLTSLISYILVYMNSTSNYLFLPYLSIFISILSNYSVNKNLQNLDRTMSKITLFWNILWFCNIYRGLSLLLWTTTSTVWFILQLKTNSVVQKILVNIVLTYINVITSVSIGRQPENEFSLISSTACILYTFNTVLIYTLTELSISRKYSAICSNNITSILFQLKLCYDLIYTFMYYSDHTLYELRTRNHISILLGYFIYDTISMCLIDSKYSSKIVLLIHHFISMYLLCILFFCNTDNRPLQIYTNKFLLLLEIGNPIMNTMKTLKILYPGSDIYYTVLFVLKITYIYTRLYIFPMLIIKSYNDTSLALTPVILNQLSAILVIIFLASVLWSKNLLLNKL